MEPADGKGFQGVCHSDKTQKRHVQMYARDNDGSGNGGRGRKEEQKRNRSNRLAVARMMEDVEDDVDDGDDCGNDGPF